MNSLLHRALARLIQVTALAGCVAAPGPAWPLDSGNSLTLEEASRLALEQQPLLDARSAELAGSRARAVAGAQLADPKLSFGIRDLPIDTAERYSLKRDSDTQLMVGVVQEFPAGDTRRLRGQRGAREVELAEQELAAAQLMIRRNATLAWLDVWKPVRAAEFARATVRQAELQVQAVEIAYTSGRATQADVLAARVALGVLRDEADKQDQDAQHGRSMLSRWIGNAAYGALSADLPAWGDPPPVDQVITRLHSHPHLNARAKQVEIAQADVAIARQSYKPAWSLELGYAWRQAYADEVTLLFGLDLPVFRADRQDRGVAAKLADQQRSENLRDDEFREEEADARLNSADWALLQQRLQRYRDEILPQGEQRIAAATAAWQSGRGTLAAVLEARRMALDNQLRQLDLQADAQKHRINLKYLAGENS